MKQANAILGLLAQTSIHAGTGQNTDIIDLPIQREGHNGYPCIHGSAMKGALRAHAETYYGKNTREVTLGFGSEMNANGGSEYAGALMISDARILLLPVRSLTSQFKWVTCPAVLNRFKQDAKRFGLSQIDFAIPDIKEDKKEPITVLPQCSKGDSLFLEEYRFETQPFDLTKMIEALASLMQNDQAKQNLEQQLAIVSNELFNHICQHATPVNAHIAINSETGVVKNGALWYEETLPPETLFYVGVSANASRKSAKASSKEVEADEHQKIAAKDMLCNLTSMFYKEPWLQVGGNETVGMGWCAIKSLKA